MSRSCRALWATLVVVLVALLRPPSAHAFCGFYVSGSDAQLGNDATQVALMRSGTRTVLSMANSYQGPPEDFALVVPVPVVLQKENVRTLPAELFSRLDRLSAPRLVEYWEQDPCPLHGDEADNKEGGTGTRAKGEEGSMGNPSRPQVRVEAEFAVDEYDVVILSADDSTALEGWLRQNGYHIPAGIEPYLRPYILSGSKFFVAKVDTRRVRFLWERAQLSPLRFHYDSDRFELPIRLGLANATGPQDLVIYILAPGSQRYEVANYENVFLPTNLDVRDDVRREFGSFYASLFDRTVAGKPRAVVTEYAWSTGSCDPCPTPPLSSSDLAQLGLDVTPGGNESDVTLTRLHARYGRDSLGDDFTFRQAPPIAGGREGLDRKGGKLSTTATPASYNTFQGRYAIRHPWEGPITCASPRFGLWGEPPDGTTRQPAPPTRAGAPVRRDALLDRLIVPPGEVAHAQWSMESPYSPARLWSLLVAQVTDSKMTALPVFLLIELVVVMVVAFRRRVGAIRYGAAFVGLVLLPVVVPASSPRWWSAVRYMEIPSVMLALCGVGAAALLIQRMMTRSGHEVSASAMAMAALVPAAGGLVSQARMLQRIHTLMLDTPPDAKLWARILSEGESESFCGLLVGLWASSILMQLAAWWRAGRDEGAPDTSATRLTALAAIGATALAALVCWSADHTIGPFDAPVLVGSVLAGAVATRLARRGASARDVLGLAALAALLLMVVPWLGTMRVMLDALSSDSLDDSQLVRIGEHGLRVAQTQARFAPALLALMVAPTALAAWRRDRQALHESWRGVLPATLTWALGVLVFLVLRSRLQGETGAMPARERDRLIIPGFEPARPMIEATTDAPPLTGPLLLVEASGRLLASTATTDPPVVLDDTKRRNMGRPSADTGAPLVPLLDADRRLSYSTLRAALAPLLSRRQTSFRWLVGGPSAQASRLDGLRPPRVLDVDLLDRVEGFPYRDENIPVSQTVLAVRRDGVMFEVATLLDSKGRLVRPSWTNHWQMTRSQLQNDLLEGHFAPKLSKIVKIVAVVDDGESIDSVSEFLVLLTSLPTGHKQMPGSHRAVPLVITNDRSVMTSSGAEKH